MTAPATSPAPASHDAKRLAKILKYARVNPVGRVLPGGVLEHKVHLWGKTALVRVNEDTGLVWCTDCDDRGDCPHALAARHVLDVQPLYKPAAAGATV